MWDADCLQRNAGRGLHQRLHLRLRLLSAALPTSQTKPNHTTKGVTTAALHDRAAHVVGVDKSEETVVEARARFPHVRFEVVDGFDLKRLCLLSPRYKQAGSHPQQQQQQQQEKQQHQQQQQQEKQQHQPQQQKQQRLPRNRNRPRDRWASGGAGAPGYRPLFDKICLDVGGIAELDLVMGLVGLYFRWVCGSIGGGLYWSLLVLINLSTACMSQ